MIHDLETLVKFVKEHSTYIEGKCIGPRIVGLGYLHRIKSAYYVLTDKADAVTWPGR